MYNNNNNNSNISYNNDSKEIIEEEERPRKRREMQAITKIVETRDFPYQDDYFWKNNGNTTQKKTGCKSIYYKCSNSNKVNIELLVFFSGLDGKWLDFADFELCLFGLVFLLLVCCCGSELSRIFHFYFLFL